MKKVAQIVTRLEFGGVESVILNYKKNMNNSEYEFHVITQDINASDCIKQFQNEGIIVHIVTHKRKSILKNVIEINRIFKDEHFDIVHSHMTLTNFYVLWLAKHTGTDKLISHSHNAFKCQSIKQKIIWPVLKYLNKKSSNIWIACGVEAGNFLYGEKSVKSGKVFIMNNAIDVSKFSYNENTREKIRNQYNLNDDLCIGHIGRFMDQKNHKYLIEIFNELQKINEKAKLMLIGTGELREDIEKQIESLNIKEKVIFVGSITNTNEYYQAMDVFVLPSLYEGLPVVSVEAQTADLPCIISENVDRRCAMTDNVKFLSINENPKVWADLILKEAEKKRSKEVIRSIQNAGYDISFEAEKLSKIYNGEAF